MLLFSINHVWGMTLFSCGYCVIPRTTPILSRVEHVAILRVFCDSGNSNDIQYDAPQESPASTVLESYIESSSRR
jgi:hypothetical protein